MKQIYDSLDYEILFYKEFFFCFAERKKNLTNSRFNSRRRWLKRAIHWYRARKPSFRQRCHRGLRNRQESLSARCVANLPCRQTSCWSMHVPHTPTGTWQSSPARTSIQPSSRSSNRAPSPVSFSTQKESISFAGFIVHFKGCIPGIFSCPTCMFIR